MVMFEFMDTLESSLKDQLTPAAVETPNIEAAPSHCTHRSIETLVVVLAVITIIGVITGIIARICAGRHFGGNGENDIEGWVERKCRSCIDGGVPAPFPPDGSKEAAEETKK